MGRKHSVPHDPPGDNGDADFPFGANAAVGAGGGRTDNPTPLPAPEPPPGQAGCDRGNGPAPGRSDGTDFDPAADGQPVPPPISAPDPFDPASLRLSHDFAALGVKKVLLAVPVRKPAKAAFFRVHPSPDYSLATVLLEDDTDRDSTYLVAPPLRPALAADAKCAPCCAAYQLYTVMDRQGSLSLWKVRLPGADGKSNLWWDTAHEAAARARQEWVRITANQAAGHYDCHKAAADLGEPDWPDLPFRELLALAFKGKLIDSLDHPVLRRLRGEV